MNLNLNKKTSLLIFSFFLFVILMVGCDSLEPVGPGPNNQIPIITSTPIITSNQITSATVNQTYTYNVTATDPDGNTLTFSLTISPTGMTINSSTGLISWTPTTSGDYDVMIEVSAGELTVTQSYTITVGENGTCDIGPAGGCIFYDKGSYSDGWRYLEAAPSDQSTGIQWYNGSYVATGAAGTAIGTGQANTTTIVGVQGAGSYAAQLCDALNEGGYSDWFLPSKDELNLMYVNLNQHGVGGFTDRHYWSSTEHNTWAAWYQIFDSGYQDIGKKDLNAGIIRVRAVRAF